MELMTDRREKVPLFAKDADAPRTKDGRVLGAMRFVHISEYRVILGSTDQGHLAAWAQAAGAGRRGAAAGPGTAELPGAQCDMHTRGVLAKARYDAKRKYVTRTMATQESRLLYFKIQARNSRGAAFGSAEDGQTLDLWSEAPSAAVVAALGNAQTRSPRAAAAAASSASCGGSVASSAGGEDLAHASVSTAVAAAAEAAGGEDSGTISSGSEALTGAARGARSSIFDDMDSGDRDRRLDDVRGGARKARGSGGARASGRSVGASSPSSEEGGRASAALAIDPILFDEGGAGEWRAPEAAGAAPKAKGRDAWSEADRAKWDAREAKRRQRAEAKAQGGGRRESSGGEAPTPSTPPPPSPPHADIALAFDVSALTLGPPAPGPLAPVSASGGPQGACRRRLSSQSAVTSMDGSPVGRDDGGRGSEEEEAGGEGGRKAGRASATPPPASPPARSERQQRKADEFRRREEERAAKEAAKAARKQQRAETARAKAAGGEGRQPPSPSCIAATAAAMSVHSSPLALAAAAVAQSAPPPPFALDTPAAAAGAVAARLPSPGSGAPRLLPARARLLDEARPRAVTPIRGGAAAAPPTDPSRGGGVQGRPLPAAGAPPLPGGCRSASSQRSASNQRSLSRGGALSAALGTAAPWGSPEHAPSRLTSPLLGPAEDPSLAALPVSRGQQQLPQRSNSKVSSEGSPASLGTPSSPPLAPHSPPHLALAAAGPGGANSVSRAPCTPSSGLPAAAGTPTTPSSVSASSRPDVWFCCHWVRPTPQVATPLTAGSACATPGKRGEGGPVALAGSGRGFTYHCVVSFVDGTLGVLSPQPLSPCPRDVAALRLLQQPAEQADAMGTVPAPGTPALRQPAGAPAVTSDVRLVDSYYVGASGAPAAPVRGGEGSLAPPSAAEWQQHPACWLTRPPGEDRDHVAAVAVCRGRPFRRAPPLASSGAGAPLLNDVQPDVIVAAFGRAVGLWVYPGPPPMPPPAFHGSSKHSGTPPPPAAEEDEEGAGGARSPPSSSSHRKARGKKAGGGKQPAAAAVAAAAAASPAAAGGPVDGRPPAAAPPPPSSLDVALAPCGVCRVHTHLVTAVAIRRGPPRAAPPSGAAYSDPRLRGSSGARDGSSGDPLADVTVVSGDAGGDVVVWSAQTLQRVAVLGLHRQGKGAREAVSVVCIDDHVVGAGGVEGTVAIWRRRWGAGSVEGASELPPDLLIREADAHAIVRVMVTPASCAPPGFARPPYHLPVVLTGGGEGHVRLWTYAAARAGVPGAGAADPVTPAPPSAAAAAPAQAGSAAAAAGTAAGGSSAGAGAGGAAVSVRLLKGHGGRVTGLHVDAFRVVSGSLDGAIKVWDLQEPHVGRCLSTLRLLGGVSGLHCSGARLAVGTVQGSLALYDLEPRPSPPSSGAPPLPAALASHIPQGASAATQTALAAALAAGSGGAGGGGGGASRSGMRKGGGEQGFQALSSGPPSGAAGAGAAKRAAQTQRRGLRDLSAALAAPLGPSGSGGSGVEADWAALGEGEGPLPLLGPLSAEELARAFELQLRYDEGRA